jgi:hypothetical protein
VNLSKQKGSSAKSSGSPTKNQQKSAPSVKNNRGELKQKQNNNKNANYCDSA